MRFDGSWLVLTPIKDGRGFFLRKAKYYMGFHNWRERVLRYLYDRYWGEGYSLTECQALYMLCLKEWRELRGRVPDEALLRWCLWMCAQRCGLPLPLVQLDFEMRNTLPLGSAGHDS